MGVARSWSRILAWYDAHTPAGTLRLCPGATEQEITELEALVGTRLPDDFRESYSLANGTCRGWLLYHGSLLPLTGIMAAWQTYRQWQAEWGYGTGPEFQPRQLQCAEIKPVWWTPLRLPLTDNGGGDHDMLDLDPAPGGTRGQIIHMSHEVGPTELLVRPRRRADQPSLWGEAQETDSTAAPRTGMAGWLAQIADELESGVHAYSESSMMVCPVAWSRL